MRGRKRKYILSPMTAPPPPMPVPHPPDPTGHARPRNRLERLAPWVDLFFKLSAGLAASIAVWRAFI